MKISTKGRYAVVIMLNLADAYNKGEFLSLKDISTRENISLKYLEKIMLNLKKSNFFISSRGVEGGYKLLHDPSYYTIGDILRASEGDMSPVSCINEHDSCERRNFCKTYKVWNDLNNVIEEFLDKKKLSDYIEGNDINE